MEDVPSHLCILLRIGNFYLGLTLIQLAFTLAYLITYHLQYIETASWIQIWLAAFILTDLCIKCMSERRKFWMNRWNMIDVLIFMAVVGSIIITCTHTDNLHHSTGNTFGATMVTIRYTVQIIRVMMLLKVSKQLREQQKYQGMISLIPGAGLTLINDLQGDINLNF